MGAIALLTLRLDEFTLALLDVGLPKKSGQDVLQEIRNKKKNVPVIIITASDSIEDKIIGLDTGADDYIVKHFSIDKLHARIRAV